MDFPLGKESSDSVQKLDDCCAIDAHIEEFISTLESGAIQQFVRDYGHRNKEDTRARPLFLLTTEHQLMATIDAALCEHGLEDKHMQYARCKIQSKVSQMRKSWERKQVEDTQDFDTEMVTVNDSDGRCQNVIKQADDSVCKSEKVRNEAKGKASFANSASAQSTHVNRMLRKANTVRAKKQMTLDSWLMNGSGKLKKPVPVAAIQTDTKGGFSWKCGVCHHRHDYYFPTCKDCGWPRDQMFR